MSERAMRPFWVHQAAEYLIGIALVSQGLQDQKPLLPTVAGTLVIANAAAVRGPLGAFKQIGRAVHRWLDVVVMAAIAVGALQPWADVTSSGRLVMLVVLLPLAFLWFYTDWATRPDRKQRRIDKATTGGSTSGLAGGTNVNGDRVGRVAGRMAGTGYRSIKQAVKNRSK
jgi:hypothetical protein